MSRAVPVPDWCPPHEVWRRVGGWLNVARITSVGAVVVHQLNMTARPGQPGGVELWPTFAHTSDLGSVDPDSPTSWAQAEALLHRAGWRLLTDWDTVDRYPAARVEPAPGREASLCTAQVWVSVQDYRTCTLGRGHDGMHRNNGTEWGRRAADRRPMSSATTSPRQGAGRVNGR